MTWRLSLSKSKAGPIFLSPEAIRLLKYDKYTFLMGKSLSQTAKLSLLGYFFLFSFSGLRLNELFLLPRKDKFFVSHATSKTIGATK